MSDSVHLLETFFLQWKRAVKFGFILRVQEAVKNESKESIPKNGHNFEVQLE